MRPIIPRKGLSLVRAAAALAVATGWALATPASEPLTPEGAVAAALAHHPLLRSADAEVAAARADGKLARSGYIPRVDFSEDVARSTNPVFVFGAKLGQQRFAASDFDIAALNTPDPITNAATRVTLRQNVWDGGTTSAGRRAAASGLHAAEASQARTRDAVALGALQAYWNAVLADAMLAAAKDGEAAAASNASSAATRVEEGLGVPSDKMQADVRLAEVRAMRVAAEQGVAVARAGLRRALGAPPDTAYTLAPPAIVPPDSSAPPPDVDAALARRADLRAVAARADQAGDAVSMARARRLPQIGFQAVYEWNGTRPLGTDGSNWTVGAGLTIPIFDGTETGAREARARADRDRALAMRDAMRDGARFEIEAAEAGLTAAAARLRTAQDEVATADEALRIVKERYDEGLTVITELLGAEAALTKAKGTRAQAVHDLALARAQERFALGLPVADTRPADKE